MTDFQGKNVVLIGAGGHALVVAQTLKLQGVTVSGAYVKSLDDPRNPHLDFPVLGTTDELLKLDPSKLILANGVGGVRAGPIRQTVYRSFREKGFEFISVVHPSAVITQPVAIGPGAQVFAGVVLQPGATIGENAIINTSASIDHDCVIGAHAHIAPGVVLSGDVRVGPGAHVGTGAKVIQRVRIGEGATVGAGAVVLNDVPDRAVAVGVPAKIRD